MIGESGRYNYLYEPFNPTAGVGRGVCDISFSRFFTYVCPENESQYVAPIRDLMEGRYRWWRDALAVRTPQALVDVWRTRRAFEDARDRGIKPLIKDPIALVSAGWIADRFDLDVIVMVRHPAAFVSSMRRMGWGFAPRNWALSQPALMNDFLEPFREELEAMDSRGADIIDQTSLAWKVMNHIVLKYRDRFPNWILVRHEDISADPIGGFGDLYKTLNLEFTSEIRGTIEGYSGEANPDRAEGSDNTIRLNSKENIAGWRKRLEPEEIDRIRRSVEPVSSMFYSDTDW